LNRATGEGSSTVRLVLVLAVFAGCHSAAPPKPPPSPPSPASITREEPGGNSSDPHTSALQRLVAQPWGWRNDKDDTLHLPLADAQNWRRVKFIGVPSFVGFRYGDAHHAVVAVWVRAAEDGKTTPEACLASFEDWGGPTARSFSVDIDPGTVSRARWTDTDIVIKAVDAQINTLFARKDYKAAYAAYSMWPGTCTIFGVAVPVRGSPEAAAAARDRYVREGFSRMERRSDRTPALQ
jgi:hypothetical protein